jgi:hypothetical protein
MLYIVGLRGRYISTYIGLIYGRYLQFRILKWPLTFLSFPSCMSAKCIMINDNWRFTLKRIRATSADTPIFGVSVPWFPQKKILNPIHWWPNFQCICCHQCIIFSHETYAPWVWDTGTCGFIQRNIVPLKSYGLLDQHICSYPQISMLHPFFHILRFLCCTRMFSKCFPYLPYIFQYHLIPFGYLT